MQKSFGFLCRRGDKYSRVVVIAIGRFKHEKHEKHIAHRAPRTMDATTVKRKEIIDAIRNRVCSAMGLTLTTKEALAVSLAATATRDREVVFGMLLNTTQTKIATRSSDSIAPTDAEWASLFETTPNIACDGTLARFSTDNTFSKYHQQLESALRCSLVEEKSKMAWSKPLTKAACYLALHSEDTETRIKACLGVLVRADSRRLDDVRSGIEDGEVDHMLLSKVVLSTSDHLLSAC